MPFTSKTSTDPGPFDALRPAAERGGVDPSRGIDDFDATLEGPLPPQQNTHSAPSATDEDGELERLFRFQEIPVSAEMRRELLGAKLPLASADQLADTQPPNKSSLSAPVGAAPSSPALSSPAPIGSAPVGPAFVDRHGPTEPALMRPNALPESDPPNYEAPLLDGDSYSTTAPTLLSVRRRRLRNRRLVMAALGAMLLAMLSGVAWRRYTRQAELLARDSSADRTQSPRIAGNRPANPLAARSPEAPARHATAAAVAPAPASAPGSPVDSPLGASSDREDPDTQRSESANPDSQSAQLSLSATDATSSSPLSAGSRSASRDAQRANAPNAPASKPTLGSRSEPASASQTPIAVPRNDADPNRQADSAGKPTKSKAFDPEELIF